MHCIIDVEYLKDYQLILTFENNHKKLVDLYPYLDGEVFEPLKDTVFFRTVFVNHDIDTIVWRNDADFSPDFLFEIGQTFIS